MIIAPPATDRPLIASRYDTDGDPANGTATAQTFADFRRVRGEVTPEQKRFERISLWYLAAAVFAVPLVVAFLAGPAHALSDTVNITWITGALVVADILMIVSWYFARRGDGKAPWAALWVPAIGGGIAAIPLVALMIAPFNLLYALDALL